MARLKVQGLEEPKKEGFAWIMASFSTAHLPDKTKQLFDDESTAISIYLGQID